MEQNSEDKSQEKHATSGANGKFTLRSFESSPTWMACLNCGISVKEKFLWLRFSCQMICNFGRERTKIIQLSQDLNLRSPNALDQGDLNQILLSQDSEVPEIQFHWEKWSTVSEGRFRKIQEEPKVPYKRIRFFGGADSGRSFRSDALS